MNDDNTDRAARDMVTILAQVPADERALALATAFILVSGHSLEDATLHGTLREERERLLSLVEKSRQFVSGLEGQPAR